MYSSSFILSHSFSSFFSYFTTKKVDTHTFVSVYFHFTGSRVSVTPSAFDMDEEDEYEDDFVTRPTEKYDSMIEDLLTMAELIDMVSDMRTKDVRAIQEFGKFIPAYAAYERNRLSLYREAAKEAESIIDRWEDELDDDEKRETERCCSE